VEVDMTDDRSAVNDSEADAMGKAGKPRSSGVTVRYSVQHVAPMAGGPHPRVPQVDEDTAVDTARGMVGPNVTQVTIEASPDPYQSGTFSIRHFTWKDGEVRDSGWRSWLDDEFVEDRHPSTLGGVQ
jgi:hypothetical protein